MCFSLQPRNPICWLLLRYVQKQDRHLHKLCYTNSFFSTFVTIVVFSCNSRQGYIITLHNTGSSANLVIDTVNWAHLHTLDTACWELDKWIHKKSLKVLLGWVNAQI